jgi:prevent-host-death family protein
MLMTSATSLATRASCGHNDHMANRVVGARELKIRLGTYLRQVRRGRTLVVTDRGQPVAELRPIGEATSTDAVLAKLAAEGIVTRPTTKLGPFRPIVRAGLALSTVVLADRDDRF